MSDFKTSVLKAWPYALDFSEQVLLLSMNKDLEDLPFILAVTYLKNNMEKILESQFYYKKEHLNYINNFVQEFVKIQTEESEKLKKQEQINIIQQKANLKLIKEMKDIQQYDSVEDTKEADDLLKKVF